MQHTIHRIESQYFDFYLKLESTVSLEIILSEQICS